MLAKDRPGVRRVAQVLFLHPVGRPDETLYPFCREIVLRETGFDLRPPGPQPERSRPTRGHSLLYSGLSCSGLGSVAFNLDPRLHPPVEVACGLVAQSAGVVQAFATLR
jgi:hypothetical protein